MTLAYDTLHVHRWMLRDRQRMEAFDRAIRQVVKPGDVVLDVGAGSGVLSLMAARAGAARVYAVERTPVARLARQLAQRNGLQHIVHVVEADILQVQLPEPVDVIVSEWLGTLGVDENLLFPVLAARDRWLKPGGVMLPSRVTARLAPAGLATACEVEGLSAGVLGLQLDLLSEASVHELLCRRYQVQPQDLAAPPQDLWTTDCQADALARARAPWQAQLRFELPAAATVNALVGWFDAELAPGVHLCNAPDAPETHWGQLTLPLDRAQALPAGAVLEAHLACLPRVPGLSDLAWHVRVDGGPWQGRDTRTDGQHDPGTPAAATAALSGDPAMPAASPPAASAASPALPTPEQAAPLTRFLAQLAVDIDMLHRLIRDPQAVFEQAGLSEADVAALVSRQAAPIEQAMMNASPQGGAA